MRVLHFYIASSVDISNDKVQNIPVIKKLLFSWNCEKSMCYAISSLIMSIFLQQFLLEFAFVLTIALEITALLVTLNFPCLRLEGRQKFWLLKIQQTYELSILLYNLD